MGMQLVLVLKVSDEDVDDDEMDLVGVCITDCWISLYTFLDSNDKEGEMGGIRQLTGWLILELLLLLLQLMLLLLLFLWINCRFGVGMDVMKLMRSFAS
jgi:hypothetical protein